MNMPRIDSSLDAFLRFDTFDMTLRTFLSALSNVSEQCSLKIVKGEIFLLAIQLIESNLFTITNI